MTHDAIFESLRRFDIFKLVPDAELEWLISKSTLSLFEAGDLYIKRGEPIVYAGVVLNGRIEFRVEQEGQWRQAISVETGQVTGALPYSRLSDARATGFIVQPTAVLRFSKDHFREMTQTHYALTQAFVSVMLDRTREFTENIQQQEKLVSLGKLSAGLAHELNNPAAAIVRSAARLKRHLSETPESFKRIIQAKMSPEQVDALNAILFAKLDTSKLKPLSLLERTALEDDLRDWFDAHKFVCSDDDANDERAQIFADFQITTNDLDAVAQEFSGQELFTALEWWEGVLNTEQYVRDIHEAASRIKKLVDAVKGYSHMDKAVEKEPVDVREGVESTLAMLSYKLREKRVQVLSDFPADALPKILGYAGELNQVWTNLIDNAIDAVGEKGSIHIRAVLEKDIVRISIIDDGEGIPKEILNKIFDPFFTTKPVGKGTGLGLDIVKKIVTKHNGSIKVKSARGKTEFELCFPIANQ
jgi:signal transduction histidine kinase